MNTIAVDRYALDDRNRTAGRHHNQCRNQGCQGHPWPSAGGHCLRCWNALTDAEKQEIHMTAQPISVPLTPSNPPKAKPDRPSFTDDEIRTAADGAQSYAEVARTVGCSTFTARKRCLALGIRLGRKSPTKKASKATPKPAPVAAPAVPASRPVAPTAAPSPSMPVAIGCLRAALRRMAEADPVARALVEEALREIEGGGSDDGPR